MTKKIRGNNSPACSIKFLSLLFISFCILSSITSKEAFPADENNDNSDSQKAISSSQASEKKDKKYKTVTINAGPNGKVIFFARENLGIAHGNAIVKYEDVTLKADHVWADLDKEVLEAEGNVRLETKDQNVTARYLLFDLRNKKGLIIDGVSFDNPWYNSGKEMTRFDAQNYFISRGGMTSCSLDHPHYSFEASQIVIHLKKEIIAKHVILKIGGIPLMYLPVYRRSLEEDKPARYIFRIGSNTFEGYYVKNALPIRWRMLDGSIFFDYTTRRGNRGGTEFDYDADKLKLREIFIPVPKDASGKEWQEAREKIDDILQRAKGEMDKVWLKQIFVRYKIEEADKEKARKEAQGVLEKCREKDADFGQQARRWSDDKLTKSNDGFLGYFVKDENGFSKKEGDKLIPVKPDMIPAIETAFSLQPDQISDIGETTDGLFIVKRSPESYPGQGYRINWIFIEFESSQKAQEIAREKSDEILTKISEGTSFEEMARLHSDDEKTRDIGGDLGWKAFQDIDISFHSAIRIITKGEVSRPIITNRGIYILKLMDKEKTPDFKDLAKEYSKAPNAELGGDMGYRNKWEIPPEIRREAYRLELFGISTPIRSEDGYRIIKVEKKSRLGGDVYIEYGDLYSYQMEKNPIKLGQTWNIDVHHNQTLWRSGEQLEEETMTRQERLRMQKSLGMRAELSLAGRQYKKLYTSYSPEQELRSYCAFDYYWTSKTGSSGNARLMIDGTKDLLGTDTERLQKYPDFGFRSPNYLLGDTQPFKKINSGLNYISDRIQGRANFADLAREFSDDIKTKEKGGDLGWVRKGESGLGTKIESDIFDPNKLSPGDISDPISISDGYHIVKVDDIEEVSGRRERVKIRHIFIAIDPNIRTKDEASKLSDEIYRKLTEGERPSLGFLTLNNTSFSFDTNIGNYYKDKYVDEKNIWLQTADASATLSKRAIIRLGINRELNLNLSSNYRQIWHSKTQPLGNSFSSWDEPDPDLNLNERDTNVFTNAWNANANISIDLRRIFYPTFVPRIYAMKHSINPYVRFYYAPPGESETRAIKQKPRLYPFGPATWTYEQKQLTLGMVNGIDIKTKAKRERISLFRWDLSAGADFTEEKDSPRRYNRIDNRFTITPTKNLTLNNVVTFNPNNLRKDKSFLSTLNTDMRYSDSQGRYSFYLSRQSVYYDYNDEWRQYFNGSIDLRWSRDWKFDFELSYEYDQRAKDIYLMQFSLIRMLHCWESRIAFRRQGVKGGYITKDFTFQIDIVADPGKSLGIGYDSTGTWSLRSLPGMGRMGGFIRQGYSTYY